MYSIDSAPVIILHGLYVPNCYTLTMNSIIPNDIYNNPYRHNLGFDTKASIARGTIDVRTLINCFNQ